MAKRVITELIDDIDGQSDARTVAFGLEGVEYEIELTDENREALREALRPYTSKARRAGASAQKSRRGSAGARKDDLQAIRRWARENGHEISERGRIPGAVLEAYRAAN